MVLTKGATVHLLEWASQKEKPVQKMFVKLYKEQVERKQNEGVSIITGVMMSEMLETFDKNYQ